MDIERRIGEVLKEEAKWVRESQGLKDSVLKRIETEGGVGFMKGIYLNMKKYSIASLACGILLLGTTGYAATKVYQLFDQDGQVSVSYQFGEESIQTGSDLYEKYGENLRKTLKPGTAALFLVNGEENPDKRIIGVQNPVSYDDMSKLQKTIGAFAVIPSALEGHFRFVSGTIDYKLKEEAQISKEMYMEAMKTDQQMIVREVSLDSAITGVLTTYRADSGKSVMIQFENLGDSVDKTVYSSDPGIGVEKLDLNGSEALFHTERDESGKEYQSITWVNGQKIRISVRTSDTFSKSELMDIANQLR
ncbi:DUF1269 domain-containing protein [Brevibacillus ruminantium]|uniref:DUF1269 domain-containing protein n=1 Tax=Brevibacillus ruminantium TaxID=2950604 RepID=A0ABY4WKA2_9BACL|nr:DUF1269 domain-containing protein [Brevibacillus ruminantium]USG65081.1 DUF1269 domain-containing protein [Brevibacillus ruminantium]